MPDPQRLRRRRDGLVLLVEAVEPRQIYRVVGIEPDDAQGTDRETTPLLLVGNVLSARALRGWIDGRTTTQRLYAQRVDESAIKPAATENETEQAS